MVDHHRGLFLVLVALVVSACGDDVGSPGTRIDDGFTPPVIPARLPLTELETFTYLGFAGGLYPGASNTPPPQHDSAGREQARLVRPLDTSGNPSGVGRYVLLSIGMSNTTQEYCSQSSELPCDAWTFAGQAGADPTVDRSRLVIVNGARGGQDASTWDSPTDANYDRIRDTRLAPRGLSERQVQIVWLKVANASPRTSLPSAQADAYDLQSLMANIARALKTRYPNLRQVFVSSRIYAGYATTALNPEPYAYESGFSAKWLIQAQIDQRRLGRVVDARAGDLGDRLSAWIGWGPYLWADGATPRRDGLRWERGDFEGDGTHPSRSGEQKVGTMLLEFFKSSPYTRCWFLAGMTCA